MSSFSPGASASITAGAATSRIAIPSPPSKLRNLHLANLHATTVVHVKMGSSAVEATTSDMPILPFESMVVVAPDSVTHIAAIRNGADDAALVVTAGWGDE